MELRLIRRAFGADYTEGSLYLNGAFECHTLEDRFRLGPKVPGETAIPFGRYRVAVTYSPRFKQRMPLLLNVPNFSGVRIHWGNKSADTEGCILVGAENRSMTDGWVGMSKVAYRRLLAKILLAERNGDECWLTIVAEGQQALAA